MEINCLPFNEKQFLSGVRKHLEEMYGSENRFILSHKFPPDDLSVIKHIPELKRESGNVLIKKYLSEWFREASVREYFEIHRSSHYVLTTKGAEKMAYYKNPVGHFAKAHWKWLVGTSLTFVAVLVAIIRLTKL